MKFNIISMFILKIFLLNQRHFISPFHQHSRNLCHKRHGFQLSSLLNVDADPSEKSSSSSTESNDKWTTVNLGDESQQKIAEMNERITEARRWESKKLSDDDSKVLNRMLGIEKELDEIESAPNSSTNKKAAKVGKLLEVKKKVIPSLKGFLEMNPFICSGCGTPFQSKAENEPGFLPQDKFKEHRTQAQVIREQQDALKVLDFAGIDIGSAAAERVLRDGGVSDQVIAAVIKIGTRGGGGTVPVKKPTPLSDETGSVEENPTVTPDICICQRCFRLQQYGKVEETLRPGWSEHELLTPERFEQLLGAIRETKCVVTCIVDVFDLKGSILKNLRQIAGNNPIVIAVNKVDLLPKDMSETRVMNWIYSEIMAICGLRSPKEAEQEAYEEMKQKGWTRQKPGESEEGILRRANIHLVSCQSGHGMDKLMESLSSMAISCGSKVYVMGAANVGKSSFINRLLDGGKQNQKGKVQKRNGNIPKVTVSNLPGTTLDFLKIVLPNGITMIDTPGLINKAQLTARLTTEELKQVIPAKPINAVTLRVSEGKCVMIGGLATIELLQGKPFFFTFFISNLVKLHPTDSGRVSEILQDHLGVLVNPPSSAERLAELGPFEERIFTVDGTGWTQSSTDIVIAGLGWVTITGAGRCEIKVTAPHDVEVALRPALLPFEASHSTAKFTGGRLTKKSRKPGDAPSYGWRA